MRKVSAIAIVAFVLGVLMGAAAAVRAQVPATGTFSMQTDTAGNVLSTTQPEQTLLKGEDLSVRVRGKNGKRVIGSLMARINGAWVEVQLAPQDSFAIQK